MPETVALYVASTVVGNYLTYTQILAAVYVVTAAATTSYSKSQQRKAERRARQAANGALSDRLVTTRGTIDSRQIVLGRVRTGGTIAYIGSSGDNKEKLSVVIALAGHRIAGVDEVWFNDEALTLDGSGFVTSGVHAKTTLVDGFAPVTITAGSGSAVLAAVPVGPVKVHVSGGAGEITDEFYTGTASGTTALFTSVNQNGAPFTGTATVQYQYAQTTSRARVRWLLGTDDQAAFADLVARFPGEWTTDHRLRRCAYLVAELDYDPDTYPSGIPNITAVVRGADEVFDPRTGTTGYTENAALLLRHYLLHPLGGRRSAEQVDTAAVIAAANVCDRTVSYGGVTSAFYTAGIVANSEQAPAEVCDELAEAMAGRWGYSGGVIRIRAGDVGAAVAQINEDWLAQGQIQVQPRRPRAQLGNTMRGTFVDPAGGWQQVPFPAVPVGEELAALIAEDGGSELPQEVEFAAITRPYQAQQVAAVLLREQRQSLTVTLECNMRAYGLQLFDTVSVSLARFGWDAKLFEVMSRSFTLGGAIRLVLRETGSSIYAVGAGVPPGDFVSNTNLPNPLIVPQVDTVTASSGAAVLPDGSVVSRVVLTWPAIADRNVTDGGFVQVGYREAGESTLRTVRADSLTGHTLVGLRGGRGYVFMAQAVNGLGVRGLWSAATTHVVYLVRGPKIFRQTTTPTGDVRNGDSWFDTDAGNAQYIREGGAWLLVRDTGIQAALDAAAAAQAAADGKIASFYQDSPPGSADDGDIWFDTNDANKQYVRVGGAWVLAADTRIGDALTAASDAQATADGKVITFVATSAPTAEAVGDLWLDSDDGNKLYRWSGSAWVALPVGTGGIATNAATEVSEFEASSITVSGRELTGTDTYTSALRWTPALTVSFTAGFTGNVSMIVSVAAEFSGAATVSPDVLPCSLLLHADFNVDGVPEASDRITEYFVRANQPNTAICHRLTESVAISKAVSQGTAYTWPIYARKGDAAVVITRIYARVEQIKR